MTLSVRRVGRSFGRPVGRSARWSVIISSFTSSASIGALFIISTHGRYYRKHKNFLPLVCHNFKFHFLCFYLSTFFISTYGRCCNETIV